MKLKQITAVGDIVEPVELDVVRDHLHIENNDEDSYLRVLISSARSLAENVIDGIIADRRYELKLDSFPAFIELPLRPADGESVSITYFDVDGIEQTLPTYEYRSDLFKTELIPAYGESWPSTELGFDKVTISFTAGLAAYEGAIPADVQHAILMIIGSLYDQREDHTAQVKLHSVPLSSQMLLDGYKKVIL